MTPTQRAIKEDLEAYEAMEEKLRKIKIGRAHV